MPSSPIRMRTLLITILVVLFSPAQARAWLVGPPQTLEEMTLLADLVCKAKVVAMPGNAPYLAATLEVITTFKGKPSGRTIRFWHYQKPESIGPSSPPQYYQLSPGVTYLFFAKQQAGRTNEFEAIRRWPTMIADNGVIQAADEQPVPSLSIRDAHWRELSLLITNSTPQNALYAMRVMGTMTVRCRCKDGPHFLSEMHISKGDFDWMQVAPLFKSQAGHADERVALAAIQSFVANRTCNALADIPPDFLLQQARQTDSPRRREAAVSALKNWPGNPSP